MDGRHTVSSSSPSRTVTLALAVDRGTRVVVAGTVLVSVVLLSLLGFFSLVSQPSITKYEAGLLALQDSHSAMLDQETGLRGYLSTRDAHYLQPYVRGRQDLQTADERLLPLVGDRRLTEVLVRVRLAQAAWLSSWAEPVVRLPADVPPGTDLAATFKPGKALFDVYRGEEAEAATETAAALHAWRSWQLHALRVAIATGLATAAATAAVGLRGRNRLRADVVRPVENLLTGLDAARAGDLTHRVVSSGPVELARTIDGLNALTQALADAQTVAVEREAHIVAQSERLHGILLMVREIGGSLNLRYVMVSVVEAVAGLESVQRTVVWLVDEDRATVVPQWDSEGGGAAETRPAELGIGLVGRAAKYGRTAQSTPVEHELARVLAVPLVVGARVIGVLELFLSQQLADDELEVVETLAVHAATAMEAARLHEATSHASEHDALTRLANRRRLEIDLSSECDRSLRYARPLSFIMIDLDHFKAVNDTFGHAKGDQVLQQVATVLQEALRTTDTAYRYGGEELAVIVRESDSEAALVLAERLRARIEYAFAQQGETPVTASVGVASMPDHGATPKTLVAAADAAMYRAKDAGRNRVVLADSAALAGADTLAH